ncbi:unnamed protein product [Soboliphyme baturini]|uniref:Uncharacterized protein n=1 Tax=Soboliphyme baturini TaxID=241478 RepID=A0A183IND1_9BILA|nr:unnamed protein product [Soboliphyme baturini]
MSIRTDVRAKKTAQQPAVVAIALSTRLLGKLLLPDHGAHALSNTTTTTEQRQGTTEKAVSSGDQLTADRLPCASNFRLSCARDLPLPSLLLVHSTPPQPWLKT